MKIYHVYSKITVWCYNGKWKNLPFASNTKLERRMELMVSSRDFERGTGQMAPLFQSSLQPLQKEQNSSGKKLQLQGLKKKEEEEVDLWAQAICYMPEDPVLVLWLPKELGNLTVQYNIWADKKGKHCAKISKIKPSRKGVFEDEFLSETEGGDKAARIYVTFDQHGYEL